MLKTPGAYTRVQWHGPCPCGPGPAPRPECGLAVRMHFGVGARAMQMAAACATGEAAPEQLRRVRPSGMHSASGEACGMPVAHARMVRRWLLLGDPRGSAAATCVRRRGFWIRPRVQLARMQRHCSLPCDIYVISEPEAGQ